MSARTVWSGTWSTLTRPECRVRSPSYQRARAPGTMPLGILLLMAAYTCSTQESSRNLYVLVCALVCREMEQNSCFPSSPVEQTHANRNLCTSEHQGPKLRTAST